MLPGRDELELAPEDGVAGQEQASAEHAPSELGPLDAEVASEPGVRGADAERPPTKSSARGIVEWFLLRSALSGARADVARLDDGQRDALRRAKVALEFGNIALAPNNEVASGPTAPLAPGLFQHALCWALLAKNPASGDTSPDAAWASASPTTRAAITNDESELARIATALGSTFVELERSSSEDQRATAELLRNAATRLVADMESVSWQLEWLKLRRLSRIALGVVLCLTALAVALALWPKKPDLAKGKPWHTSSVLSECHPANSECGGVTTDIFFHTREEANPWFEYDLGAPQAFSSLTIRNRSDCCIERTVPLVVEVSNDNRTFHEVARRTSTFSTWSPSFSTQHARYLRLRIARVSMLHLEAVEIHP